MYISWLHRHVGINALFSENFWICNEQCNMSVNWRTVCKRSVCLAFIINQAAYLFLEVHKTHGEMINDISSFKVPRHHIIPCPWSPNIHGNHIIQSTMNSFPSPQILLVLNFLIHLKVLSTLLVPIEFQSLIPGSGVITSVSKMLDVQEFGSPLFMVKVSLLLCIWNLSTSGKEIGK